MSDGTDALPQDVVSALDIARKMIVAGIPVFAAPPCPSGPFREHYAFQGDTGPGCSRPGHAAGAVEYDLPPAWQQTVPATVWLERWQPGWALAAVGGHAADFLDEDPRNGGTASVTELGEAGHWPTVFGVQRTKSGGYHYLISPVGERKITGLLPGLDYQGGAPDGKGRGFIWLAPTVGIARSGEAMGSPVAYSWVQEPDLDWLADFGRDAETGSHDPSLDGLRLRIAGWRARGVKDIASARERSSSAPRTFTPAQMEHFLAPFDATMRAAPIGQIEETANTYACVLSHFVPAMLTQDQAFDRLTDALGQTAYNPAHPASGWHADKFRAVIADVGGRAPADWHAVPVADVAEGLLTGQAQAAVAAVDPEGDEVTALLAEMLTADELASREPPRFMIDGLLQFDSESWMIGEPGSRKSFVALDMAAHVATGRAWQGRRVNPAVVVFIVAEGAGGSAARVQAWQKRYGAMGAGIRFLPRPVQAAKVEAWAVLVRACERLAVAARGSGQGVMVVLDTQARVTVGLKENDATDMGVFTEAVRLLREATGGCVLTIHHTGRRGGDARGSSAIDGAQTTELKVTKVRGLYGKLITEKQKDITEADDIPLKFAPVDLGQDADGRPVDSLVLLPADAWSAAEMNDEALAGLDAESAREVNPFSIRAEPETWTLRLTHPNARLHRWLLQALADVAQERGLTQAEWKGLVDEKLGKQPASTWRNAFQAITDGLHEAVISGVVVKAASDRWTVDRVALESVKTEVTGQ